jgi:hypothetical protein
LITILNFISIKLITTGRLKWEIYEQERIFRYFDAMFTRKAIPYIPVICLLLACNSHPVANNADSITAVAAAAEMLPVDTTVNINMRMHAVDSIVSHIKAQHLEQQAAYLPPMHPNDTLFTQLYFKDKIPARLSYTTFEDSGEPFGMACFYFDPLFSIIHERTFGEEVVYGVVMRDGKYFSFSKSLKDNTLKFDETPESTVDYNTGGFLKYINDLIQLYPGFKFDIPVVKLKGDFALRVIQPVALYAAADTNSMIVDKLQPHTRIGYLQSSVERMEYRGKTWIWYKVKSGEKVGWVVGHPDWVEEITGEDLD